MKYKINDELYSSFAERRQNLSNATERLKEALQEENDIVIDCVLHRFEFTFELRNSLSHLYDEETSRKIYKEIKEKYIKLLEKLNNKFENLI